jgi:hypothetical protein
MKFMLTEDGMNGPFRSSPVSTPEEVMA